MKNRIPMTSTKAKAASKTRTPSMLQTLVDSVAAMGHYVSLLSVGGNVVTFMHDSVSSITQISTTHVYNLQRHGDGLKLMECCKITWVTPTGSGIVQVKLWIVPNVTVLNLREKDNTVPSHVMMMENPRLGPFDAYLGQITLIRLSLTTEHSTGVLYGPFDTHIKMWKSKGKLVRDWWSCTRI